MTLSTMYPLVVGGGATRLTEDYTPGTLSVTVETASCLPTPPNYISIIDDTHVITLLYSSITSNTIGGLSIVEYSPGGDSRTYPVGSVVGRTINKADMDAITNNLDNKLNNFASTTESGKYLAVNASGAIVPTEKPQPMVDENGTLIY